jgi:hypothetical protein
MRFFVSFWTKIFSILGLMCSIPWKIVFALVCTGFSPRQTRKCLKIDSIPGFKYSHLNISEPMHYRKMVSLVLLFAYHVSGQKPGGGATSHAIRAGGRTQNLMIILKFFRKSNLHLKINLKITTEINSLILIFFNFFNFYVSDRCLTNE